MTLLQHHQSRIQPGIQRIVWVYRRWQPLYTEIQKTVSPKVEFHRGIPPDIDDDAYFDSGVNNVLILDDIMSVAGRDNRITDLFTEGSHHRSLSVIAINQNLYASKDPTQRRNCHYLVLFNNPIDKQSIMTLARQMYPGNTDHFLKRFGKAAKQPYGYLFVDLKPFTPETHRLKCNITWPDSAHQDVQPTNQKLERCMTSIKDSTFGDFHHSQTDSQTAETELADKSDLCEIQDDMTEKMNSCDDCGLLFDTAHDVQRHVKRGWCAESQRESPMKKQKMEERDDETVEENPGFLNLWQRAVEANDDRYDKLYNRFVSEGETDDDAQDLAEDRVQSYDESSFFKYYTQLLEDYIMPLQDNPLHQQVMDDLNKMTAKGASAASALKKVLKQNANQFQTLFDVEFSDDEESDDEDESDSDEDEYEDEG